MMNIYGEVQWWLYHTENRIRYWLWRWKVRGHTPRHYRMPNGFGPICFNDPHRDWCAVTRHHTMVINLDEAT